MSKKHPFTIKVEPHAQSEHSYRQRIFESGKLRGESIESYPTMRQAEAAAHKFVQGQIPGRYPQMTDERSDPSCVMP